MKNVNKLLLIMPILFIGCHPKNAQNEVSTFDFIIPIILLILGFLRIASMFNLQNKYYVLFAHYVLKIDMNKNPNDASKSISSTDWYTPIHWCSNCNSNSGNEEYYAKACNSCGSFNTIQSFGKSHRKIFYKGKWRTQFKYNNSNRNYISGISTYKK